MKTFVKVLVVLAMVAVVSPVNAFDEIWVAVQGNSPGIVRLDPTTHAVIDFSTAGNLGAPRGMEYDFVNNVMYVTAYTNGVAAFKPDGTFLNYKYTGNLTGNPGSFAWDVAMDDTYVYVGQFNGPLHRFLKDGTPAGAQIGSLHSPNNGFGSGGLAYLDGKLYVSSTSSSSLDVYNATTGVYSHSIATSYPSREVETANGKLYYAQFNGSALNSINADGTGDTVVLSGGSVFQPQSIAISPDGTEAAMSLLAQYVREFDMLTNSHLPPQYGHPESGVSAVGYTPEPASLALVGLGGLMLIKRRRA